VVMIVVVVVAVLCSHLALREWRSIDGTVREGSDNLRLLLVHLVERHLLLGGEVCKAWSRSIERTATVHAILMHSAPVVHVSAIVHGAIAVAEAVRTYTGGPFRRLLILELFLVRPYSVQKVIWFPLHRLVDLAHHPPGIGLSHRFRCCRSATHGQHALHCNNARGTYTPSSLGSPISIISASSFPQFALSSAFSP